MVPLFSEPLSRMGFREERGAAIKIKKQPTPARGELYF
jgi:hypothetical protein